MNGYYYEEFLKQKAFECNLDIESYNKLLFKKLMTESEWKPIIENYRYFDDSNDNPNIKEVIDEKVNDKVVEREPNTNEEPTVDPRIEANEEEKPFEPLVQYLEIKSNICDICSKRFATKYTLTQHKLTIHQNIRRFVCDVDNCGKNFAQKYQLSQHKSFVHFVERKKSYKCNEEKCGKSFSSDIYLALHQSNHMTGQKCFICGGCGQSFPDRDAIQLHLKTVHTIEEVPDSQ